MRENLSKIGMRWFWTSLKRTGKIHNNKFKQQQQQKEAPTSLSQCTTLSNWYLLQLLLSNSTSNVPLYLFGLVVAVYQPCIIIDEPSARNRCLPFYLFSFPFFRLNSILTKLLNWIHGKRVIDPEWGFFCDVFQHCFLKIQLDSIEIAYYSILPHRTSEIALRLYWMPI